MKDVIGYEGLYEVDAYGNVYSVKRCCYLKPDVSGDGYEQYTLSKNGKTRRVFGHRIVAGAYLNNELNKPCVNHIDGVKTNNHVSNLEWCTNSENNSHAYRSGLKSQYGEKNHRAKHTEKQMLHVLELLEDGTNRREISSITGISLSVIGRIARGERWLHLKKKGC